MNIRSLAAALLLVAVAAPTARAASLALVPADPGVAPGSTFTIDLVLDASDAPGLHPGLYGGAIVIDFDSTLLGYDGFTLASGLTFFASPVTATNGTLQTVSFGFENAPDTGVVGTFRFIANGPAGSVATIGLVDADDFSGSFANYLDNNRRFYPVFTGADVSIVPLPAGVWLLGSALGALVARRRFARVAAA